MMKNPTSAEFEKHSLKLCSVVPQELLEKVKKRRVSKCDEFETLIVEDVGRKGPWWMLKQKDGRLWLRFVRLAMVVDGHEK